MTNDTRGKLMNAYELLFNDNEVNRLIDNVNYKLNEIINFVNKTTGICWIFCCHGKCHAMYVVDTVEYILRTLSYNEHIVMLGKIAGLLHDIGNICGRDDHARIGGDMSVALLNKTSLTLEDKHIIHQAIQDHGTANNITSAVGAALIIADKTDGTRERNTKYKDDLRRRGFYNEEELNKHDRKYGIDKVNVSVADNVITINWIPYGDSQEYNNLKRSVKVDPRVVKAAEFLKCTVLYIFNGEEIELI